MKAELLHGARSSKRVAHTLAQLARSFALFESLPFGDDAAQQHGTFRTHLRSEGQPSDANDMMIAASALAGELTLVTRNVNEFHRVAGLRREIW